MGALNSAIISRNLYCNALKETNLSIKADNAVCPDVSLDCVIVCHCSLDMKEIENAVRSIEADGLLWGACKYNPNGVHH